MNASATATGRYIGKVISSAALLAWNLFVMAAAFCLGLMMDGKQARRIWAARLIDHPFHPVSERDRCTRRCPARQADRSV